MYYRNTSRKRVQSLEDDKVQSFPTRIQFPATCIQIRLRNIQIASTHFTEVQNKLLVNGIHGDENKNEGNWIENGECVAISILLECQVVKSGQSYETDSIHSTPYDIISFTIHSYRTLSLLPSHHP